MLERDRGALQFQPDKLKVSGDGAFYTLQGEGVSMGEPAVFLRLHRCNLKCVWCLSGNTLVQTPKKKVKIRDIKIGDEVLSFDKEKVVIDKVIMTYKRKVKKNELLFIKLDKFNEDKIFVTKEHRFCVKGKWVKAKDLKAGDEIASNEYGLWRMKNNNPMQNEEVAKNVGSKLKGKKSYERTEEHRLLQREKKLGYKNPRYVNGKRPSYLVLWKKTRSEALERDNYTCQNCGSRERLEVHHIVPYRISKDNSLKNLITLCKSCHLMADNQIIFHNGIKILDIKEVNDKQMARLDGNKEWCYVYNIETWQKNYFAYNLLVHNCDTPYTWKEEDERYWTESKDLSIPDAANLVRGTWGTDNPLTQKRLVVTGGEPMLQQKKIVQLADELGEDWKIEVETNGTIPPSDEIMGRVQFNCSPKLGNSENPMRARVREVAIKRLVEADATFKFVVTKPEELDEIQKDYVEGCGIPTNKIILMPEGTSEDAIREHAQAIAEYAKEKGLRMLGRMQVSIWGAKRGI